MTMINDHDDLYENCGVSVSFLLSKDISQVLFVCLLHALLYAGTRDQTALGDLSSSPPAIDILSAANVTLHRSTPCHSCPITPFKS